MRFLGYEKLSPEENMSRDEGMLLSLEKGNGEPSFRIYTWSELCVSIGLNQQVKEFPVKVVRRPTGGGALLHGWDLSFSVADYRNGKSPLSIYKEFSLKLKELFSALGVPLEVEKSKAGGRAYFCFFFPSFGELRTPSGKKLVALAMRTLSKAFLLHGSVYVRFDYKRAGEILGLREEEKERITTLEELGVSEEDFRRLLYSFLSS